MKRWNRLFYYLVLNVIVSAGTMLAVLLIWDRTHPGENTKPELAQLNPIAQTPTITPFITMPTNTPAPEPTKALQTYLVQQGETLGEIALRFDISVDELMKINTIIDPNTLGAGTVLFVPKQQNEVEPDLNKESAGEPPPTITPAPGDMGSPIMIDRVVGAGDLRTEFVLVRGTGKGEVTLTNWVLQDDDGNQYVFPHLTLFKDGAVALHTSSGLNTVVDLYWGLDRSVWDPGDFVVLTDAIGNVRATYQIP